MSNLSYLKIYFHRCRYTKEGVFFFSPKQEYTPLVKLYIKLDPFLGKAEQRLSYPTRDLAYLSYTFTYGSSHPFMHITYIHYPT